MNFMETKGGVPQRCLTAQAAPQLSSCLGQHQGCGYGKSMAPPCFFGGASTPQPSQAGAQRVGCFIPELHNEAGTAPPPGFQGQKEN